MIPLFTDEEYQNAKGKEYLKLKCEQCGNIFTANKSSIKMEYKTRRGRLKYCSLKCANESFKSPLVKVICLNCGKEFEIKNKVYNRSQNKHFFCGLKCSAQYNKNFCRKPGIERFCHVCGKSYRYKRGYSTLVMCSPECKKEYRENIGKYRKTSDETKEKLRWWGQHRAHIQNMRSKNEIYFCELCESYFEKVLHNERMFNGWDADVIIEDIKIAVLWNGIWHHKKICKGHSVKQTQARDKIKMKMINECGYMPYVIDDFGSYNPIFVEKEFEKFKEFVEKRLL